MKIKYDKIIDAKYIRIKSGNIAKTEKKQDWLLFDCDKSGEVLGIEILDASKHPTGFFTVGEKLVGYGKVKFDNESTEIIIKDEIMQKNVQVAV